MPRARPGPDLLIVDSTEHSADLLYATRFHVPDDIVWFRKNGRTHALLSPLEIDRARAGAAIDRILSHADWTRRCHARLGRAPTRAEEIALLLKSHGLRSVTVPDRFPTGLADALRRLGLRIRVSPGQLFPERELKTPAEIRAIESVQRVTEAGLARGLEVLAAARSGPRRVLRWGGAVLTSERLRGEIDATLIRLGALPARTIVAGGVQACDPHEIGHGPLRAGEAIILDIFPRDQQTGYYADMTRTVVKGRAPEPLRALYATVLAGQNLALSKMREGVDGGALHREIVSFFTEQGYPTRKKNGRWVGFFHGTGHSLGLEIHEPPRFGATTFRAGQVMTVEPGLYDPAIGGVRIEDLVVIRKTGIRNLTRAPKTLEIR